MIWNRNVALGGLLLIFAAAFSSRARAQEEMPDAPAAEETESRDANDQLVPLPEDASANADEAGPVLRSPNNDSRDAARSRSTTSRSRPAERSVLRSREDGDRPDRNDDRTLRERDRDTTTRSNRPRDIARENATPRRPDRRVSEMDLSRGPNSEDDRRYEDDLRDRDREMRDRDSASRSSDSQQRRTSRDSNNRSRGGAYDEYERNGEDRYVRDRDEYREDRGYQNDREYRDDRGRDRGYSDDRDYRSGDYNERDSRDRDYYSDDARSDSRSRRGLLRDRLRERLQEARDNPEEFRDRVNTAIRAAEQFGFSINQSGDDLRRDARETFGPGQARGPALGVSLDVREQGHVRVSNVRPDSPAERAGVQRGDEILLVDGRRVSSLELLKRYLSQLETMEEVELVVLRDGREVTLYADLSEGADTQPSTNRESLESIPPPRESNR